MRDFDGAGDGRIFIAVQAGLFLLLGYALLFAPGPLLALVTDEPGNLDAPTIVLRIAGAALGCLALPLLCLLPLRIPEISRRIVAGLYIGDVLLALAVSFALFLNEDMEGVPFLLLFFLFLGLAGVASQFGLVPPWLSTSGEGEPADLQVRWQAQIEAAAAQQERNRLARDLHDSIKQQLFSIRVGSATVDARWDGDPEGAREALRRVRQSAHEATVEMQALLLQLRPAALANAGLVEALREQAEALGYRTGAKVEVEVGQLPPDGRVPAAAQEALFRIAQEALANVARHARASAVHIRLGRIPQSYGEALVLEVQDDGQGFDPAAPESQRGMGLRNLRDRIQPFDGTVEVESAPGQGAAVRVSLPLARIGAEPPPERSRKLLGYIQGTLLVGAFLSFAILFSRILKQPPHPGLVFFDLSAAVYASFYVHADENKPLIARTALERIYLHCVAVWMNPIFLAPVAELEEHFISPKFSLALAVFSATAVLFEAGLYAYWRRRHPEPLPRVRRWAVPGLLAAFAATVGLGVLVDDPGLVSRWALGLSAALAISWWLRLKLGKEEA
ncbi:MAG TPA: sensor histidine kinase [Thermoanaerobaculia bacterium]|nr:sensor histidine kinase [Thermoanaerobaculia bacterium]